MAMQTFESQIEDIHTLIKEMGLAQMKLSSRISRLENRMLVTQQAVRDIQLKEDDTDDNMEKFDKKRK